MHYENSVLFIADTLIPVIQEVRQNRCNIYLVKDDGLYMMAEEGEILPDTGRRRVAYAVGFNPAIVEFDEWYHLLHDICGGDDFAETLQADSQIFDLVVKHHISLKVEFTPEAFSIIPMTP